MNLLKAYLIFLGILIMDQVSKIYIKTNFVLGDEVEVFSWFKIHFIENEGMAWGTVIPGTYGKLILTLFRLCVVPAIAYWLWDSVKKQSSNYLIIAISFIFAGAVGNIIDSVFYGVIFDDSTYQTASLFSDKPYGTWLYGKVVDMLYFPIFEGDWPDWFPFFGGQHFRFFNAIFNVADTAISTGVGVLIVFNKKAFQNDK